MLTPFHKRVCQYQFEALLNWNAIKGPARGLENMGNTCFMNSALQCLASTPSFAQFLALQTHKDKCRVPKEKFCTFCWAENFIGNLMHSPKRNPATPKILARNIRAIGRQFRLGRQEDAHEFLRCFIDHMTKSALETAMVKEGDPAKRDVTTSFNSIFGGYFRNQLKCSRCGYCSNTYENFLDLSLDVGNGIDTVGKALRNFASIERLDESNMWKCKKCNKPVCAAKQMTVHIPPKVLTIQLKRFSFFPRFPKGMNKMSYGMLTMGGGCKLQQPIQFPFTLDISSVLSDVALKENRHIRYDLHGVLVHQGHSASSGHYYSYCKAPDGTWYCMNDESVTRSSPEQVARQQAYLLFYSQIPTTKKPESTNSSEFALESPRTLASPLPSSIAPLAVHGPPGGENPEQVNANRPKKETEKPSEAGKKRSLDESQNESHVAPITSTKKPSVPSSTDATDALPDSVLDLESLRWKWHSKSKNAETEESVQKELPMSFSASSEVNPLSDRLFGIPGAAVPEPPAKKAKTEVTNNTTNKPNASQTAVSTNEDAKVAAEKHREVIPPLSPLSYIPEASELAYFRRISTASLSRTAEEDSNVVTVSRLMESSANATMMFPTVNLQEYKNPSKWDTKNVQIAVRRVTPLPPPVHMKFDSDNEDEVVAELMKERAEREERRKREEMEAEKRRIEQIRAKKDMPFPVPPSSLRIGAFTSQLATLPPQLPTLSGKLSDTSDDSDYSTDSDSQVVDANTDTLQSSMISKNKITESNRAPKITGERESSKIQPTMNELSSVKPQRAQLETIELVKTSVKKKSQFDPSVFASHRPAILESKSKSALDIPGWDDDYDTPQLQKNSKLGSVGNIRKENTAEQDMKSSKRSQKDSQFDEDGFRVRLPDEAVVSDAEWDAILDAGRVKKVKDKDALDANAAIGKEGGNNAFQQALEKRLKRQAASEGKGYRKGQFDDDESQPKKPSGSPAFRHHKSNFRGKGMRGGPPGRGGKHGRGGHFRPIAGAGSSAFGKSGLKFGITPHSNLHKKNK